MSNSRVNMHQGSSNTVPYVKFDGIVTYKPTQGTFSIYLMDSKESKEIKEVKGALITRRNVVLATSIADNPVTSQDFDSFDEKLYFRETIKNGKVVAKDVTYSEAKDSQHKHFASNSFRLATSLYLVTEKGATLKVILTGTTRQKVNEQLDAFSDEVDFITLTPSDKTVTVGGGARSKEVYEVNVSEEKKKYERVAIDKINNTVKTLQDILEYKKSGKTPTNADSNTATTADAEEVFDGNDDDGDLPI